MQDYEMELSVGDVVCLGHSVLTVVDIDGQEVSFRVDKLDDASPIVHHSAEHAAPPGK